MPDELSFNGLVKEELAHLWPSQECCRRSEFAALLRTCGTIEIQQGRLACRLITDHGSVARKILRLARGLDLGTEVVVKRRVRLRKNLSYQVRIPHQPGLIPMLTELGILAEDGMLQQMPDLTQLEPGCRKAFLRGLFLGSGWVNTPEKEHHLELTIWDAEGADSIGQMLFGFSIRVRTAARKETIVLYVKEGDQVSRLLGLMGAHQALLRYEDVRALKEMKNLVNRQVNADAANLSKSVDAAVRQSEALQRLQSNGQLERLTPALRELALLRIHHPEATLKELGELCNPPVGKSGVNHRMRQLMKLCGVD